MHTSGLFLDGHAYNGTTLFQKFLKRSASSTTMAETAAGSEEPVVEQINLVKICRTRMGRQLGTER